MVPYEELAPLMRASDALLNPSLFEGWSTSVEEARSAGVPMLLSDLAVHREQAGDLARYFDPRSAESLAEAMAATPPRSNLDELAVSRAAQERVKAFADAFVAVVHAALSARKRP
jgi:glycosyltransferase involved in cell wall biosynthesis